MPSPVSLLPALALLAALVSVPGSSHPRLASARQDSKVDSRTRTDVTADDVKTLKERFQAEREAAVKAKFPPESLARPDDFAKRAEAALQAGDLKAAARYFRDARWQIPYLPAGLPPHVTRVLGESRMRHAGRVNAIAYSPDGTKLASSSYDGTVKIWDLGNGRDLVTYRGHAEQADDPTQGTTNVLHVGDVAFAPDGKTIASAGGSQVHLWDPATGKLVKVLFKLDKADKPLKAVAFRPDGKFLAIGGEDGFLRVVEVANGAVVFTSPSRNSRIEKVAYSPNGKMVAIGDSGGQVPGSIAVYVPETKAMPMSGQGTDIGEVFSVAFTADSTKLLSAGRDGKVRLTVGPKADGTPAGNTYTKEREFTGHDKAVFALAVSANGKHLVTGGEDKTVRVWDINSGKPLRSFQGHTERVSAVAIRPDGRQIASASDDGSIRLWDLNDSDDHKALTDAADALWTVAFSPDGKRLAAAGADHIVRVYQTETGKLEAALTGHTAPVTSLAFLPDNIRLVSVGGDKVVRVWDVPGKKPAKEMPGHTSAILAVAVGPGGKLVVTGSADRTVRGWDPDAGKQLWSWTGKSYVCAVSVRKDGRHVAVGTADGKLTILDTAGETPKEVSTQAAHVAGVACATYSPDGARLATAGGDGMLKVWATVDPNTPSLMAKFDPHAKLTGSGVAAPLTVVAFSADGRYVAGAGADAVVRIWDVQTRTEIRGLRGHAEWVTAVAFSPDSRLLASAGVDKVVRVFELAPQESASATGHVAEVRAVSVSPDGKTAATASKDHTTKLWDLASGRELATLTGEADKPDAVAFLGNEAVVIGGSRTPGPNGQMHFWTTKPARLTATVGTGEVYTLTGAADGSRVAAWAVRTAAEGEPNHAYEVYTKAGELVAVIKDSGRQVRAVTFTPDLSWSVSGDEGGNVRIWDLAKKDRVGGDWALFANAVKDLGVTPDKRLLAAVDDKGLLKVADVQKRETLFSGVANKAGVRALVVSPAGDTVLTIGEDRELTAWSLKEQKELKAVRSWKLPAVVNGAAYAPDGKTVVTANADGTAYVLELP